MTDSLTEWETRALTAHPTAATARFDVYHDDEQAPFLNETATLVDTEGEIVIEDYTDTTTPFDDMRAHTIPEDPTGNHY